jgi:hypothetical protein
LSGKEKFDAEAHTMNDRDPILDTIMEDLLIVEENLEKAPDLWYATQSGGNAEQISLLSSSSKKRMAAPLSSVHPLEIVVQPKPQPNNDIAAASSSAAIEMKAPKKEQQQQQQQQQQRQQQEQQHEHFKPIWIVNDMESSFQCEGDDLTTNNDYFSIADGSMNLSLWKSHVMVLVINLDGVYFSLAQYQQWLGNQPHHMHSKHPLYLNALSLFQQLHSIRWNVIGNKSWLVSCSTEMKQFLNINVFVKLSTILLLFAALEWQCHDFKEVEVLYYQEKSPQSLQCYIGSIYNLSHNYFLSIDR